MVGVVDAILMEVWRGGRRVCGLKLRLCVDVEVVGRLVDDRDSDERVDVDVVVITKRANRGIEVRCDRIRMAPRREVVMAVGEKARVDGYIKYTQYKSETQTQA